MRSAEHTLGIGLLCRQSAQRGPEARIQVEESISTVQPVAGTGPEYGSFRWNTKAGTYHQPEQSRYRHLHIQYFGKGYKGLTSVQPLLCLVAPTVGIRA